MVSARRDGDVSPAEPAGAMDARRRRRDLCRTHRRARNRVAENEAELIDLLERQGVRIVVPGTLSVAEQIAAFRAARLVIGPHGAGMSNIVFCQSGSFVYEMLPRDYPNAAFNRLAQAAGVNYWADLFEGVGGGMRTSGLAHRPRRCRGAAGLRSGQRIAATPRRRSRRCTSCGARRCRIRTRRRRGRRRCRKRRAAKPEAAPDVVASEPRRRGWLVRAVPATFSRGAGR